MENKKLFLLDGMALIYRAFFAFSQSPRITSYGLNTSAMYGFTNTLMDLLKRERPSHIAVVFDTDKPTERHILYEAYKAQREAMPEDLSKSIPYIFDIIRGFKIPVLTMDGFEADDIIGTLAKKAEKEGYKTYMMTPDKDFGQLVSDHIFIYKPARMGNDIEVMGVKEVLARWEISRVDQVIDMLALMGDAVDNIPGVPGIGEKTARKLLAEFDHVENLLANTNKLKGKQKENVEQYKEQALLSKVLATINCEVPIELDEASLIMEEPDLDQLSALFQQLEFRALTKRLQAEFSGAALQEVASAPQKAPDLFSSLPSFAAPEEIAPIQSDLMDISQVPHVYTLIDDDALLTAMLDELQEAKAFCFDTETTGLDALNAELVGMAFSNKAGKAWYLPFQPNKEKALERLSKLKKLFQGNALKVGQNLKYDLMVLANYDFEVKGPFFDTMLAHYLIEPDSRHNMDALAERYLNYSPISITTLIGKKGQSQLNMRDIALDKVAEYAAEDADITFKLYEVFAPLLKEQEVAEVFENIEIPLMLVLADMERKGVKIDENFLNAYAKELEVLSAGLEQEIYNMAGMQFNIGSPRQLGEVLFDHLKLDPKAKKTKTGQYQTGEEVLSALAPLHPLPAKVIEYRQVNKLKSTYVEALPALVNPKTGRVHTSFNQAVAATGRLSSQNPNLQNIPIRTEMGREVRKAFVPASNEFQIMAADYSQIELRIIAAMSGEKNMIADFEQGLDIHSATAARVFGVDIKAVDKDMRRKAKMVNFGIIYGISAFGLAQRLEIPRREAADIINAYFTQYPGIKNYMDDTIRSAQEKGYVETVMGRRRYIRDINSRNQTVRGFAERNAINAPVQGSAADMIKMAMIRIHQEMNEQKLLSSMILQVHDELLFEVHESEIEVLKDLVKKAMLEAIALPVPLEVEIGLGQNWLEAH